jgi:hypothetical protein
VSAGGPCVGDRGRGGNRDECDARHANRENEGLSSRQPQSQP